jgi:hypothetical protein
MIMVSETIKFFNNNPNFKFQKVDYKWKFWILMSSDFTLYNINIIYYKSDFKKLCFYI